MSIDLSMKQNVWCLFDLKNFKNVYLRKVMTMLDVIFNKIKNIHKNIIQINKISDTNTLIRRLVRIIYCNI